MFGLPRIIPLNMLIAIADARFKYFRIQSYISNYILIMRAHYVIIYIWKTNSKT